MNPRPPPAQQRLAQSTATDLASARNRRSTIGIMLIASAPSAQKTSIYDSNIAWFAICFPIQTIALYWASTAEAPWVVK
jgi:hypothetical protein